MNDNHIISGRFSNPDSEALYHNNWPTEFKLAKQYEAGLQCGGCSYFAKFDSDWGLCCSPRSRHRFETIFEHFTCPSFRNEGWGPHSFSENMICRCGGEFTQEITPMANARPRNQKREKR